MLGRKKLKRGKLTCDIRRCPRPPLVRLPAHPPCDATPRTKGWSREIAGKRRPWGRSDACHPGQPAPQRHDDHLRLHHRLDDEVVATAVERALVFGAGKLGTVPPGAS